jgi:long-chain acyl-CoA synthetase
MHPSIHATNTPDKAAIIMASTGQTVSYQHLNDASNQVAQMLRAAGLKAGDVIALMLENSPAFFELAWGAQRVFYVPVDQALARRDCLHHL